MDVSKVGRGRGRGRPLKELATIRPFFGSGRGRGRAGCPAQEVEDGTSSTSSEEEVPKRMGKGRGRGRAKQLEAVGSPMESGWDIGIRAECSKSLKPAINSAAKIEARTSSVNWDPFTVLPKEIYLKIFNKLEDPNDKRRFMNANTKWYDLFKDDRPLFLFGNVLEILAKHGNGIDRAVLEQEYDYSFNHVTQDSNGFSDSNYLNLRLVCRAWDDAIQAYNLHHPSHYRLGGEQARWSDILVPIFETDWVLRKQFRWRNAHTLEAQLQTIALTHPSSRNPFLTRNVRLEFRRHWGLVETQNYRAQVDTLLETYGRHIWHCQFEIDSKINPETFSMFVKWLSLMPEIKTLDLSWHSCSYESDNGQEISDFEIPEMIKLSVIKCNHFKPAYFNELLRGIKGPLDKILFGNNPIHEVNDLSSVPQSYDSLRKYQIPANVTEARLLLGQIRDTGYLKEMPFLPRLRKLKLHLNFQDVSLKLWKIIWKVVEETFPQLEELNLVMPRVPIGKDRKVHQKTLNCRLNMLKLKKLRVVLPNLASLDFILPLKELEELQIVLEYVVWDPDEPKELGEKEIIDFNKAGLENMWESNIWEVLPKLRKLHIKAIGQPSEERRDGCSHYLHYFPFCFVHAPDPYKGESEWHLYGYVKEGMSWQSIFYDPARPWRKMYKLFYISQSNM